LVIVPIDLDVTSESVSTDVASGLVVSGTPGFVVVSGLRFVSFISEETVVVMFSTFGRGQSVPPFSSFFL
jgi:hypothetical protein